MMVVMVLEMEMEMENADSNDSRMASYDGSCSQEAKLDWMRELRD